MAATADLRNYNVLSIILVTQSCIVHEMKGNCMFYNICIDQIYLKCDVRVQIYKNALERSLQCSPFCFFLQLYLSHSHMQYVKRQVIVCSTTLVYHSHIEKCDLKVEKGNKLNPWRPSWKMAAVAVKTQNPAWQTKYSCSATQNH